MGLFSKIKKQFKKDLKRTTKVLDPVGHQLRKSTGGSYGDPMNWYNSKPNQTVPYERPPNPGLMAPPGAAPTGHKFGSNTGGRTYTPNPFAGGVAPQGAAPPGMMGKGGPAPLPTGPMKNPMSFGGAPQGPTTAFGSPRPQSIGGWAGGARMGAPIQQLFQQPQQQPQPMPTGGPNMQMLQAQLLRGRIA